MKNASALALVKRFIETDPQQASIALEGLGEEEAAGLVKGLPPHAAASCLERVRPAFAAELLGLLPAESAADLLVRMGPDHAADAVRALPESARPGLVDALPPELRREILDTLSYPEDSAGRLMRTDFLSFVKDVKVREVVSRLRQLAHKGVQNYVYVVSPEKKLLGVLNMRDLLLASPEAPIESIMRQDVFSVAAFTDREELIHLMGQRNFLSVPVLDAQGRLIGAVKTEDLLETSQEEATEDVQMMFGASAEERAFSPLRFKIARRLPWLNVNLVTAFAAAGVVAHFEDLIGRVAVLAVFLPIIAGQGGNAGIQSLAVVLRGLVIREVRPRDAWPLLCAEIGVALVNGLAIGVVTAVAAWLWRGNAALGLVVGLAMLVNMLAAGLAGAGIPLLMKRWGFDPAQSSGIFLTTVTDVIGFFAFLGFASVFERWLY